MTEPDQSIATKIDAAFEVLTDRESRDWKSIDEAAAYLRRITRGAAHLGKIVAAQNADALAAIGGAPDLIDETGDGDWEIVWERVRELGAERDMARGVAHRLGNKLTDAEAVIERLTADLNQRAKEGLAREEALRAQLNRPIQWPTFDDALDATPLGHDMVRTMLRLCQEAVAKAHADG